MTPADKLNTVSFIAIFLFTVCQGISPLKPCSKNVNAYFHYFCCSQKIQTNHLKQ